MKKYQNSLLAGVAALALVAGTGLAMAQQSNEHGGSMGGSKGASPQAGQSMNHQSMGHQGMQPQAQSKGTQSQTQAQNKGGAMQNQAQERDKTNANQTAQTGNKASASSTGHQAENNMGKRSTSSSARAEHMNRGSRNNRQNTAERQRTLKGLQGNAQNENQQGSTAGSKSTGSNQAQQQPQNNMQRGSQNARMNGGGTRGGNVQLSEQQRTQIKTTVINGHNAPRVGSVDFDVRVGTAIPRGRIHVVPVPETLVRIEPRWRGFLYFVYQDEVIIVNPHNYHIVAVVAV
jgi:hypothetical protein